MSVNFSQYQRSNYSSLPKTTHKEERFYDVFNNPKQLFTGRNEDHYFINMQAENPEKPPSTDLSILRRTLQHSQLFHQ